MRIRRLLLLFALAAAVAAVAVPSAGALTFPDEICPVAQGTVVKICPPGEVSKPYSMQIKGREGTGCVPYVRFKSVGSLPPGLTLSTDGLIGGTPTQAGEWTFWIEMQDIPSWEGGVFWCGDDKSTEKQFSVTVNPGISIVQNALNPKVTFLNKPYSFQLSASGVSSAQTWSVKSGALPSGMTIGSNGVVSGTPTAAGDFTFVIQVSDGGRSTSATYTLTVVEELKITQAKPPAAEVGQPFAMEPKATGGRPALSWSVAEGGSLPAGLTLDPATGAISGKPTLAGSYPLKLTVTDQLGLTQSVDVTVGVAAKLSAVKKALPVVTIGKLYKARLTARGGATPLKWRILGGLPGFLPTGIKFSAKTGEFSGVAKGKTGLYRLRMQVTDKLGVKASLPVVLKVVA